MASTLLERDGILVHPGYFYDIAPDHLVTADTPEETLRAAALADERVRSYTDGREIVKVIVVPNRLVNVVVR